MDSDGATRARLLADLRDGVPEAFRQLVEEHQHKVLNTCYRFVHEKEDAEDLAQETFIEVHRSLAKFRGDSDLSTWIYRIAVSKSLDFLRRRDRAMRGGRLRRVLRLDEDLADSPGPVSSHPDAVLEQRERRRVLQTALDGLPKNQRIAFVLSKYDGMSYQEIAGVLKTTVSSVESLIHRARKNLQRRLHDYYRKEF
jgi:RNA polymerase sigma-70 factor (ECF subfamily)